VARARAHGDEHRSAQRLKTQDRQCCAMEPRGKALERGAAERAEARTVAERSTGEAGGRSKRELLLEAYYSTPCSCCTCTAALLYVHFSAAAGGDRRRCSGRTIARLDVHRRRCWTCPVGPTGRALPALLDVHRRRCCTCTAARRDVHCRRCCTCTVWRGWTCTVGAAGRAPSALLDVPCRPYWTCTAGAAGRAPSALLYVHCCAAGRALLRCCTCTAALLYVHCCADVRALLRCCTCTAALLYVHCRRCGRGGLKAGAFPPR
jgi:hypothetical protein